MKAYIPIRSTWNSDAENSGRGDGVPHCPRGSSFLAFASPHSSSFFFLRIHRTPPIEIEPPNARVGLTVSFRSKKEINIFTLRPSFHFKESTLSLVCTYFSHLFKSSNKRNFFNMVKPTKTLRSISTLSTTASLTTENTDSTSVINHNKTSFSAAPNKRHHQQQQQRRRWWQEYVVRNSVPILIESLDRTVSSSAFLQETPISSNVALFARSEVLVGKVIGSGGFSDVYEIIGFELSSDISARCDPDQQRLREIYAANPSEYCIKVLTQRLTNSKQEFTRAALDLVLEAAYLSRLNHANILKLRGLSCDGVRGFDRCGHEGFFLITDRLTHNLEQQIHDPTTCPMSDLLMDQNIQYALQLAQALQYLHERRIVFRDLKPHNIGFDRNGTLILFDFGLCREIPSGACGNTDLYEMSGVGTRRYLAPEVLNAGCYNLKADVYGWALVTWEMMSGHRPFAAYSIEQHRIQVCLGGERPRMRLDWPQYLQDVLKQSWRENVSDRLDMATVVHKLNRALNPPPLPAAVLPDSPVCVHDFIDEDSFRYIPNDSCLRIPDLPPLQQRRQVSLDPRLLPSHEDAADAYENDTSDLEFDRRVVVLDNSLLGFTINLGEDCGVEVCANPDAFWICPSSSSSNERDKAESTIATTTSALRRMIRPSCSV